MSEQEITDLREVPWPERRLIGIEIDRLAGVRSWAGALQARVGSAVSQTTSAVRSTVETTAKTATATVTGSATVAAAAGKGTVAAAAAGKAAAATASATVAASTAAAGAATTAISAASTAAAAAVTSATVLLGGLAAAPAMPAVVAAGAASAVGLGAWRLWAGNLEEDLRRVSPGACASLRFPPGHPLRDRVYALHPLDAERYLPIETFHQTLFLEKEAALMTLLRALGAHQVTVTAHSGHASPEGFSDPAATPLAEPELLRTEVLPAPTAAPHIPPSLPWLEHEPAWRAEAERRLGGAGEGTFELDWSAPMGIEQELLKNLRRVGWKPDGVLHFLPTVWRFHALFR